MAMELLDKSKTLRCFKRASRSTSIDASKLPEIKNVVKFSNGKESILETRLSFKFNSTRFLSSAHDAGMQLI
jgi:hypothetical protein